MPKCVSRIWPPEQCDIGKSDMNHTGQNIQ